MKFRSKKIFIFFLSFLLIFMITVTPFGAYASDLTDAVGDTYVPDLAHNSLDYTSWMFNGMSGPSISQPMGFYADGVLITNGNYIHRFIFIEFNSDNVVIVNYDPIGVNGTNLNMTTTTFAYEDCIQLYFGEVSSDEIVRPFFEEHMLLNYCPLPMTYSYNLIVVDGTVVYESPFENMQFSLFDNVVFEPAYLIQDNVVTAKGSYVLDNSNTLLRYYGFQDEKFMMSFMYFASPDTTGMRVRVFDARGDLIDDIDLMNYDQADIKIYSSGCTFVFVGTGSSGGAITSNSARFRFYVDINDTITEGVNTAYNQGYTEGYDDGHFAGYEEGYNESFDLGYESGYNSGYNAGYGASDNYQLGFDTGYDEGYIKGGDDIRPVAYQEGYNVGFDEGYSQGHHVGASESWGENILGSAFEKPIELINGFTLFSVGDVEVTLGGVVGCVIALTLFIVFLKMFAGG